MTTTTIKRRGLEWNMDEGWSAFIFLALALIMVTWSINEAGYDESLRHLVFVTIGATLGSILLAKSRFPAILSHLVSLIYGVAWNAFILSFQLPETFTARDKLLELGYRIGSWFQKAVIGGQVGTDPLMFTVVMSILFWIMTYLAIWASFRAHNLWIALLPSGITLLLNLYYGPERISFVLVPYLLFTLLFIVRFNLFNQERGWKNRRVRYDTDIVYTFLRYGALLSLVVVTIAWVLPAAASSEQVEVFVSRFSEPWDRLKDEWIRLFSTLQSERVEPNYGGFGGTLSLGGPVNLGNITLMDVDAPIGRYWRAAVYDRYDGASWQMTDIEPLLLEPGQTVDELPAYEARRTVTQTFTLYMPGTTQLYSLGEPERFSIPIRAEVHAVPTEEDTVEIETLARIESRYKLDESETYMAVSTVAMAEEEAMRAVGSDYPAWTERYLQLPETFPQRVQDLAEEITAEYDNAYDKVTALEAYLRTYTYNDQIQEPPPNVDRVDYFLFEMKEGYCNYYASAMVTMARSIGIPARLAAGYVRGDWEEEAEIWRVRQNHAHAWVEVYFPRFGWVEFEPTANQPVITRPRSVTAPSDYPMGAGQEDPWEDYMREQEMGGGTFDQERFNQLLAEQRRQELIRTWTRIGGVVAVSIVIILIAWWQGRRKMDEVKPARAYYEAMLRAGDFYGSQMELWHTPNEYATQLSDLVHNEDGTNLISRITHAYVGERYGNKNPARYQPDFAWRDLRPILTRWGIGNLWRRLWTRN